MKPTNFYWHRAAANAATQNATKRAVTPAIERVRLIASTPDFDPCKELNDAKKQKTHEAKARARCAGICHGYDPPCEKCPY